MLKLLFYFTVALCVLLFLHELLVHFIYKIKDVSQDEAREIVNGMVSKLFNTTQPEPPLIDVRLTDFEWQEFALQLGDYYINALYRSWLDIPSKGVIEVSFRTSGLKAQYKNAYDALAQAITIDIINYYMRYRAQDVAVHIRTLNEHEVVFFVAYNRTGINWINTTLTRKNSANLLLQCPSNIPKLKITLPTQIKRSRTRPILLGYRLSDWKEKQIKTAITLPLHQKPHLLLTGESGSGKSYCLNILLYHLSTIYYRVWFGNFKSSKDFAYLDSSKLYACGDDVENLINNFYDLFDLVRKGHKTFNYSHILVLDEYPSFIQYLTLIDKKRAEGIKKKIATLLMMGRDVNGTQFAVWITAQRADASLFASGGSRDNFMSWISLGNISAEASHMITSEKLPDTIYQTGEGIVKTNGMPIDELIVPEIVNMQEMNEYTRTHGFTTDEHASSGC